MLKLNKSAVPGQARDPIDLNEVAERLKQGLTALSIRSAAAGALATMTEPVVEAGDVERREAEAERKCASDAEVWVRENAVREIETIRRARQSHEDLHILAEAERKRANDVVAPSSVKKSSQAGVHKNGCPEWLRKQLRSTQFLDRVGLGSQDVGKALVPGTDFSAGAVVRALQEMGIIKLDANLKTMRDAIRAYYNDITWCSRDTGDGIASTLVARYKRGEVIANQSTNNAASQARATMRKA